MKIAVTGAHGLLGWHSAARIHAMNCAARYRGDPLPHDLVMLDRAVFGDPARLADALSGVEAILHFAGVNRGPDEHIETGNPAIADALIAGCRAAAIEPAILYANSTQSGQDSPYGRSKQRTGDMLAQFASRYTDLVLPHIFGECARPHYNNVTATLIAQLWEGTAPTINAGGHVQLLHAGDAADMAIDAVLTGKTGRIAPAGRSMSIPALFDRLRQFHELYDANIFPDLADPFDLALFNSYRTGGYPDHYPRMLHCNADARGILFEAAKGGNGAQTFLSSTVPGAVRGNHFHLAKVERFLVVQGEAIIRIRRILSDDVHAFRVSGHSPAAIDMPPLHTHSIENCGDGALLTLFWTHDMFDPAAPDTFADPV